MPPDPGSVCRISAAVLGPRAAALFPAGQGIGRRHDSVVSIGRSEPERVQWSGCVEETRHSPSCCVAPPRMTCVRGSGLRSLSARSRRQDERGRTVAGSSGAIARALSAVRGGLLASGGPARRSGTGRNWWLSAPGGRSRALALPALSTRCWCTPADWWRPSRPRPSPALTPCPAPLARSKCGCRAGRATLLRAEQTPLEPLLAPASPGSRRPSESHTTRAADVRATARAIGPSLATHRSWVNGTSSRCPDFRICGYERGVK